MSCIHVRPYHKYMTKRGRRGERDQAVTEQNSSMNQKIKMSGLKKIKYIKQKNAA